MPVNIRAHLWTAGILLGTLLVVWFVVANPKVILWLFLLGLAAAVYYVVYLLVRARFEMTEETPADVED